MYWVVYIVAFGVLVVLTIIFEAKGNGLSAFTGILAYIWGLSGLVISILMPTIVVVNSSGDITEKKYCLPGHYILEDGTQIRIRMDTTYILNEGRLQLCLETVLYQKKNYVGKISFEPHRDTVDTPILRFSNKEVSAFVEAPASIKAVDNESVRHVTVVSLKSQNYSPVEASRELEDSGAHVVYDNYSSL